MNRNSILACTVLLGALTLLIACGSQNSAVSLIPGTENIAPSFRITVSPDDRWLAFWEHSGRIDVDGAPIISFACIDLKDGSRVVLEYDWKAPRLDSHELAIAYEFDGWNGNVLHIHSPHDVKIEPANRYVSIGSTGRSPGACSDCPSRTLMRERISTVIQAQHPGNITNERVTAAWNGHTLSDTTYYAPGGRSEIYRILLDRQRKFLIEHTSRWRLMRVSCVRVSPTGRYLAYATWAKLKLLLPDQQADVYLLDLHTNERRRIWRCGHVKNLIWTSDGSSFFIPAEGGNQGIYRVDVSLVFNV